MLGTNEILTSKRHVANGQTRALNDVIACEQAFGRAIFFPKKNREPVHRLMMLGYQSQH